MEYANNFTKQTTRTNYACTPAFIRAQEAQTKSLIHKYFKKKKQDYTKIHI